MSISGIGGAGSYSPYAPAPKAGGGLEAKAPTSARDEFNAWARMTPAERMRANILSSMGLTEDQVQAMAGDERKAVEDAIQKKIKEQVEQDAEKKTGMIIDVKA